MSTCRYASTLASCHPSLAHFLLIKKKEEENHDWLLLFQVQMAAYQSLGPFISTFADPADSGFYINEDGILTALPERELETPPPSPTKTEGEPTSSETTSGELNEE